MFNSTTLEVAIGMAFIYLLLSLFCTAFNEAIAAIFGSRARNLEKGIQCLFTDGLKSKAGDDGNGGVAPAITLTEAIYDHGLVQSLYRSTASEQVTGLLSRLGTNLPSYISSRTFSSALLDVLFPETTAVDGNPNNLAGMLAELEKLPDSKAKQAICALVKQAGGDMAVTRRSLEAWFDDGMDRAAGWYKRKTQFVLFAIGLVIAVGLNVDSIAIGRTLWISPALRSYSVAAAEQYARTQGAITPRASDDLSELESLSLPIGWNPAKYPWMETRTVGTSSSQQFSKSRLLIVLTGWFLTAIAMTLGAPFWFDLLNQIMVIRSTIKPQEKSSSEASKDPQS
jgi:stage V sporulation protein SpoVS